MTVPCEGVSSALQSQTLLHALTDDAMNTGTVHALPPFVLPTQPLTLTLDNGEEGRAVVGASLMCFSVDPQWGNLYFVLGKERKNRQWPAGSERWSDFGGRTMRTDINPETTAAREFLEETLAMVRYFEADAIPRTGYVDIADSLRRGEYTFQFTLELGVVAEVKRCYVTFVKQIPWDTHMMYRFNVCRNMITNIQTHYGTAKWTELLLAHPAIVESPVSTPFNCKIKRSFLEKKKLALWSVPQLQHAVEFNGIMCCRNGNVEQCRPAFTNFIEVLLSELSFYNPGSTNETPK